MSIPPLVCSTPPPPDQCEDDKDPGHFDIPYNLSQDEEDEENMYGYGDFSTYSNFETAHNNTIESKPQELRVDGNTDNVLPSNTQDQEHVENNQQNSYISTVSDNTSKFEEDINIEDLNLELDEDLGTNTELANAEDRGSHIDSNSLKEVHVTSISTVSQNDKNSESISDPAVTESIEKVTDIGLNKIAMDAVQSNTNFKPDIEREHVIDIPKVPAHQSEEPTMIEDTRIHLATIEKVNSELPKELNVLKETNESYKVNEIDDDFGDFEDFQFTNSENKTTMVENCDNPWVSNEAEDVSEFGGFTANFEETQFKATTTDIKIDPRENQFNVATNDVDDDDDFGDFDDFKCSLVKTEATGSNLEDSSPCEDVPVLNLHATESDQQILESISKVLTSIFMEEITEPESEFEGKLESVLSETWGHLMQTDERQPYIVQWNNSLGQKTLLKSLCIDSRNILFGPKWNTNMPKYAANLTAAPLQPQKPLTPSNACSTEANTDKASSKPATWADPFTSDGQEFTYAEALLLDLEHLMATLDQMAHNHNHSTIKISELLSHACNSENQTPPVSSRPPDLDVFEAAVSLKTDKIYPNTLSVQPRQISLPDTHIFTPTDSETPRSKTIHYDCSPTVLLSQPVVKDTSNIQNTDGIAGNAEDDSEYWEFQGFQGNSNSRSISQGVKENSASSEPNSEAATSSSSLPTPAMPFQTQPLQPIKVEPAVPTLNWPEPGEVKGAFDDFSDFVSNSSQSIDKQSIAYDLPVQQAEISNNKSNNSSDLNVQIEKNKAISSEAFDDDFDTFKSALPSLPNAEFAVHNQDHSINRTSSSKFTDFDCAFSNSSTFKSETISFPSLSRPNEALTQSLGHIPNAPESVSINTLPSSTNLQTNVLQPTPVSFNATSTQQQKTGQILQPLSLESYSQINWPSPGMDLQDLSRFNPVETLQSLKSDLSVGGLSKTSSPAHSQKGSVNQVADDDVWGEFVSSKPKPQPAQKKQPVLVDDDEWTDFISSPSVKPQNGLNTISLNVHTNSNIQKSSMQQKLAKSQVPLDIPTLNYITPKSSNAKSYNDKHFQNL